MKVWAIGDLHLSFGVPNKSMDIFGPIWQGHPQKIEEAWRYSISIDDLVLIPGDISWAMRIEEAKPDLEWIDRLPGTKVIVKGNHDYWWGSLKKVTSVLPPSIHLIQNNSFRWKDVAVGGTRLWESSELRFDPYMEQPLSRSQETPEDKAQHELNEKIFERELIRLEESLSSMADAPIRIAMTHFPPIGADLKPSKVSDILEKYRIQICVFGHLHGLKNGVEVFGVHNQIRYVLASGDFLRFQPVLITGTNALKF